MTAKNAPSYLKLNDDNSASTLHFDASSPFGELDTSSSSWSLGPTQSPATFGGASAGQNFLPMALSNASSTSGASTIGASGSGLVFDNTFDSGLNSQYLACITAAETFLSNLFTNNLTLKLDFSTFDDDASGDALTNSWNSFTNVSYSTLKAALPGTDVLPGSDPNSAGGNDWALPEAYARMLGLNSSTPSIDDTVKINLADSFAYGQDVINGIIHEITEGGMGRVGGLGDQNNVWSTMDLFRYTASGTADYTDGRDNVATFFSSNGGASVSNQNLPLKGAPTLEYNNQFSGTTHSNTGDTADYVEQDVFGFVSDGETITLTQPDLQNMQALGWHISLKQDTFNINGSGNWETATDWGLGAMPITMMDAAIGGFNACNVVLSDDVTVYSISVNASSTLTIGGATTLDAIHGTFINPDDSLFLYSGNEGTFNIDTTATLLIGYDSIGVTFDNSGTLNVGVNTGFGGTGLLNYGSGADLTLNGGGKVNLGSLANQRFSTGDITGGDSVINVDDTISGGGIISGDALDNQVGGKIIATQSEGNDLNLRATTRAFTNEGLLAAADRATLDFGVDGASETMTNTGNVFIGDDGTNSGLQGDLAISGNYTVNGSGGIRFKGAGSRIISDGVSDDTLTNTSSIFAITSGQIGDAGVYGASVNDLTFNNSGSVYAAESGAVLTLNTGSHKIADGGGLLEAENTATLVIDSPVTTGQSYILLHSVPPGGTIEATTGGTVDIAAAITSGVIFHIPFFTVPGQVVVDSGSFVVVQSGGSVAIPIDIHGASGSSSGGTLTLQSGGSIAGTITFSGTGGTFNDTNTSPTTFNFAGSSGAIHFPGAGNTANIANTGGGSDSVTGSAEAINESSALVSVTGGANTINFTGGSGNQITVLGTAGLWDTVHGSGGGVNVTASQVSVVGGSDTIVGSAGSYISLYSTAGNLDAVSGTGVQVILTTSQASVTGGSNTIYANAGSSISLFGTGGNWDAVNGASDQIVLTGAQAAITGGLNVIGATAGSSASLAGTSGHWDAFNGASDTIVLSNAQATITGGLDTIWATNGSSATLTGTAGHWDAFNGSHDTLALTSAQAAITGQADVIYANANSSVSLAGTSNVWDTFNGSDDQVILTTAQASITGGADTIFANAGSSMSLYSTAGHADLVTASSDRMVLTNVQAGLTGSNDAISFVGTDTLVASGSSEIFAFAKAMGLTGIGGFNSSDVIYLSAADWSSFSALQGSGDLKQSGANTLIALDAADTITLANVTASTLTSAQFKFT